MDQDPLFQEDILLSTGTWKMAVKAIAIIAAVNTVVELSGQERAEKASDLLAKRRADLPVAMVAELQTVIDAGGGPPSGKKPRAAKKVGN